MNTPKVLSFLWVTLAIILNLLEAIKPILPTPWPGLITGVLGVLTFYHIYQSHTPAALGAAGYTKKY